ncbi:E3 ubiquitin-protein ligase RNF126-like [Neoarius graeffei]|uniref:E3 ubiquitin-protein ligase RNF126-like n=1 Tax=Neoarius graeffei TaxID=443677 RepID=UPI00298BC944|nr:E3 ubiquitin-protein ligase RNF126-like [Neoarius graeffei]
MAEAPLRTCQYFCHQCSEEISPRLPDYACPRCGSGFIEELPEERRTETGSTSTSSTGGQNRHPFENVDPRLFTFSHPYNQLALDIFEEAFDFGMGMPSEEGRDTENQREGEMPLHQRYRARQPLGRWVPRRQGTRHEGVPTLEGIIQQLINGVIASTALPNVGMVPWEMLHSNPMDYAWNGGELDAIITQLLNRLGNTGPPPADQEMIKNLPTVQITEEHVGAGLECPVCKEEYTEGESVRELPCSHLFHNDCIVPWLEQHDTCPVCRKSLSGQNTATDSPNLSGMNLSPSSSSSSSSSSS